MLGYAERMSTTVPDPAVHVDNLSGGTVPGDRFSEQKIGLMFGQSDFYLYLCAQINQ